MAGALKGSQSVAARIGPKALVGACSLLQAPDHGVWAIAKDVALGESRDDIASTAIFSSALLGELSQQVESGEDLTAGLLVAHSRVYREIGRNHAETHPGASVIAFRINKLTASFEVAWVGDMQAYLVRNREVLPLATPGSDDDVGESRTNALLMNSTRLAGLGNSAGARPIIDRKLGHAQSGDMVVLAGAEIPGASFAGLLKDALKGVWSLDYKLQKLQSAMQSQMPENKASPVLIWKAR